jgi:hypothetical protein
MELPRFGLDAWRRRRPAGSQEGQEGGSSETKNGGLYANNQIAINHDPN